MSIDKIHAQTFKQGSKTYFNSSRFFPKEMREDVFILYGFVRVADNFVDQMPQDKEGFYNFKEEYLHALQGQKTDNIIISTFIDLMRRKNFNTVWVDAFLNSMELDLTKCVYHTLDETLEYIYGSAEVIGLFMARIMQLPEPALHAARMQGRSMQYINFIRDIKEDNELGRQYLPLQGSKLKNLKQEYVMQNKEEFFAFHRKQIALYKGWQQEAEAGYKYIPKRLLVPIKTAADMYLWTAHKIECNPFIVFEKKVKPGKLRIVLQVLKNLIAL